MPHPLGGLRERSCTAQPLSVPSGLDDAVAHGGVVLRSNAVAKAKASDDGRARTSDAHGDSAPMDRSLFLGRPTRRSNGTGEHRSWGFGSSWGYAGMGLMPMDGGSRRQATVGLRGFGVPACRLDGARGGRAAAGVAVLPCGPVCQTRARRRCLRDGTARKVGCEPIFARCFVGALSRACASRRARAWDRCPLLGFEGLAALAPLVLAMLLPLVFATRQQALTCEASRFLVFRALTPWPLCAIVGSRSRKQQGLVP